MALGILGPLGGRRPVATAWGIGVSGLGDRWLETSSDGLKGTGTDDRDMEVTVEVAGEDTHAVEVDPGATYAEVLSAVDLSPHEASVLVDGRPVPEDQPVEAESITVLRLIKGG